LGHIITSNISDSDDTERIIHNLCLNSVIVSLMNSIVIHILALVIHSVLVLNDVALWHSYMFDSLDQMPLHFSFQIELKIIIMFLANKSHFSLVQHISVIK